MNEVIRAAAALQAVCMAEGWRFCFIGGLAVQRWGEPRETVDVDLTLLTGFQDEARFVSALIERFEPRIDRAAEFARVNRVLLLRAPSGVGLDIALGGLPFEETAVDRSSGAVVVERKTHANFVTSLLDGRLFPQAAALAHGPHRPLVLLEGPRPVLRFIAAQIDRAAPATLKRFGRKPTRIATRRLYVLQGLPGVGPTLAGRLLARCGSVERVMTADAVTLAETGGLGPAKAARIRELLGTLITRTRSWARQA